MKRIIVAFLILALLSLALLGGKSLWALRGPENGRTYNREWQKRNIKPKWGRCKAYDKDLPLRA